MSTDFTSADIPNQRGKTFFITGANTGIGFETAKAVAGKGGRVLLGCRNPVKGREAVRKIQEAHSGAATRLWDLSVEMTGVDPGLSAERPLSAVA